jgi:hypothetical protein
MDTDEEITEVIRVSFHYLKAWLAQTGLPAGSPGLCILCIFVPFIGGCAT